MLSRWVGRVALRRFSSGTRLPQPVSLHAGFKAVTQPWSPAIGGQINDMHLKLVKLEGEFVWHHHDDEDECFIVMSGRLRMRFRDGDVDLEPGELIVVPKGVEHCPVALTPVHCLLVERGSTLNTGSAADEIGDAVHASGSVPLTKKELPRL